MTYGNGVFVAVGGWSQPRVVVTVDGKTWNEVDKSQFDGVGGGAFCVLYVDGNFYMMPQHGNFMRSPDGRNWQRVGDVPLEKKPKMQRVRDLAFGNGIFVGVGDYGAISVSKDMGKTWTVSMAKHHGADRTWPIVEFGAGKFVIGGVDGYTATSTDGIAWENDSTHDGVYKKISELNWTGKEFFAIGSKPKGARRRDQCQHTTDCRIGPTARCALSGTSGAS